MLEIMSLLHCESERPIKKIPNVASVLGPTVVRILKGVISCQQRPAINSCRGHNRSSARIRARIRSSCAGSTRR